MKSGLAMLVLTLAACTAAGAGGDDNTTADGNTGMGDANPGCGLQIAFDPMDPVASSVLPIRVYTNELNQQGVLTFTWTVSYNGMNVTTTEQASDGSQINFIAPMSGTYYVTVQIGGPTSCNHADSSIYVSAPGANADVFRLRTVPAPNLAPPQETYIQVKGGGGNIDRAIALDAGISVTGLVKNTATNTGISAYVKFMPRTMPTAFTELLSSASGAYNLRLLPVDHDVLVIPTSTTLAPKLVPWTLVPMTTQLGVGPGTVVTGSVHNPAGAGFAGAKVQLYAGGVPSTIGTTAADGSFSVRTDFPASATQVTVKVTPPAASGLPRLEATSAFNLATAININYAASLVTCNLQNTPVQRVGASQANAQVSIVGTLTGVAGTIGGVNATNTVRVSATADGTGRLPSMLVPRGMLSAVTELSTTDHALTAIDTSACNVIQIDAPAMTTISGTTKDANMNALPNIRIEAEPIDMLALAGVAPIHIVSDATTGAFSLSLAGGGRYNVRFTDPKQRAAPLTATNVTPGGVPTNAQLAAALAITGEVTIVNNSNPVIGASVQILCATCSGLDVARPIAETATNGVSRYAIAVPDPGTM